MKIARIALERGGRWREKMMRKAAFYYYCRYACELIDVLGKNMQYFKFLTKNKKIKNYLVDVFALEFYECVYGIDCSMSLQGYALATVSVELVYNKNKKYALEWNAMLRLLVCMQFLLCLQCEATLCDNRLLYNSFYKKM